MRIVTWNVNGFRAALRKGFAEVVEQIAPDVLLLQEIRVHPDQLPPEWASPPDWDVHWHPADRKGYSGTAVWSRQPMKVVGTGLDASDPEARVLRVRVNGIQVVCVYLPSGSSGPKRQRFKEAWMRKFLPWSRRLASSGTPVVVGGDLNIAHTERDIFYAKSNETTSGFLPHERKWIGRLLKSGWSDFLREYCPDAQGPYSWWSNRGRARELDRGWRIDYLLGNAAAGRRFQSASIDRERGIQISDHAPVIVDLK